MNHLQFSLDHVEVTYGGAKQNVAQKPLQFDMQPGQRFGIKTQLAAPMPWETVSYSLRWDGPDNLDVVWNIDTVDYVTLFPHADRALTTVREFVDDRRVFFALEPKTTGDEFSAKTVDLFGILFQLDEIDKVFVLTVSLVSLNEDGSFPT